MNYKKKNDKYISDPLVQFYKIKDYNFGKSFYENINHHYFPILYYNIRYEYDGQQTS